MFIRNDNNFEIILKNAEGIPVLQLCGTVTKTALRAVKSTIDRLAAAGHYHIVLDIEKANLQNLRFLTGLAGTLRNVRSHYGTVDVIAAQDRVQELLSLNKIADLFRLCRSETEAILRIKRLSRQPDGLNSLNAHLQEKS